MSQRTHHFQLVTEVQGDDRTARWRFELKSIDGSVRFEAEDEEPSVRRERVELLAVVRGLESLEQPSHVTLLTASQYVRRGIAYGLDEWRRNGWHWEHFGQMVQVKNHDLWRRLDHALGIHQVDWKQWRIDAAHPRLGDAPRGLNAGGAENTFPGGARLAQSGWVSRTWRAVKSAWAIESPLT